MPVLLLVLDGLPVRHVGPRHTPALALLAESGGAHPEGGVAVMPAATYPNHASFVTGVGPEVHGLVSNEVPTAEGVLAADLVGPRTEAPTLFDACRGAGRSTAAVFGDQHLVGATAAAGADHHWPPGGVVGPDVACDAFGYPADSATAEQLVAAVAAAPDLVVAQLNGPDTAGHLLGPDTDEALAAYRATDDALAVVLDALRPSWADWAVLVVSDHDQEMVTVAEPLDLAAAGAALGHEVVVVPEGGAALVVGPDAGRSAWVDGVDDIAGSRELGPDLRLAWSVPGRYIGAGTRPWGLRGVHGGPTTAAQVAVVGGGHPAVRSLAAALVRRRPHATDWAPTVAALLDVPLPTATGRPLL